MAEGDPPPAPGSGSGSGSGSAPVVRPETISRGTRIMKALGGLLGLYGQEGMRRVESFMTRAADPEALARADSRRSSWRGGLGNLFVPMIVVFLCISAVVLRGSSSGTTAPLLSADGLPIPTRVVVPGSPSPGSSSTPSPSPTRSKGGKRKGKRPARRPPPEAVEADPMDPVPVGAQGEAALGEEDEPPRSVPLEDTEEVEDDGAGGERSAGEGEEREREQQGGEGGGDEDGGVGAQGLEEEERAPSSAPLPSRAARPAKGGFPWLPPSRPHEPFKVAGEDLQKAWEEMGKERESWVSSWRTRVGNPKKLPGTSLVCKCGSETCASFDKPSTSYILADFTSADALKDAVDKILNEPGSKEVVVRNNGMPHDEVMEQVARASEKGYRGEVLERGAVIYGPKMTSAADGAEALKRFSTGGSVVVVSQAGGGGGAALPPPAARKSVRMHPAASGDPFSPKGRSSPLSVSFVIQYFRRPALITRIVRNLRNYGDKIEPEVLVNDDSNTEHEEIMHALEGGHDVLGGNVRYWLVHAGNTHEIRGYNRLTSMARSEVVMLLQDDDVPTPAPSLVLQAASNMLKHPKLALVGSMNGQIQGGPGSGRYGKARGKHVRPIARKDADGKPFMFVSWVNLGPFVIRRSAFLKVGQFHLSFSCRGDPGIGFDYEYGIRLWQKGYEVGLAYSGFRMHAGRTSRASGTRSSGAMKARRDRIEKRNTMNINRMYKGFYVNHTPDGANKDVRGKAMSLSRVCPAARLPTVANRRLK